MKKITILLGAALITSASFAQYRSGGPNVLTSKVLSVEVNSLSHNKAAGDTLFYFDGTGFYLLDANDNTDFALANQDYDGGTPAQTGWPTEFIYAFYDDDANETPITTPGGNFFPNDLTSGVDSAWYIGASSWFSTPATANNWWNFGPITIPANTTGNVFSWWDKHNPGYTDSYDVYVVNMTNVGTPTAPDGAVDVLANSLTPDFSRAQVTTGQPASDTSWTMQSVNVDAFVGQRIFIYFNHTANDGDILALDEMIVKEGTVSTGVDELNTTSFNVYPNPSVGEFNVNLTNDKANNVNLIVRNVLGKTIINRNVKVAGQQTETISLTNYSKGVYFLTIENKTVKLIKE